MLDRVVRKVRGNAVAWVALFFALTGTGVAASRYVITSTSQIKPSVLKQLREQGANAATIPKGPKAIVARVRLSSGPFTLAEGGEEAQVPVTGASWTQAVGQAIAVIGQITVTSPPREQCRSGRVTISFDNSPFFVGRSYIEVRGEAEETVTYGFEWEQLGNESNGDGSTAWILEPATATAHTLHVVGSGCPPGHHLVLDSLEIDVLAVR